VQVEIYVPNPEHKIKPGMFARIVLILERREKVPIAKDSYLLYQEDQPYVFRVESSIARRQPVKLGLGEGDRHEVLEGLKAGDIVVVRGANLLRDGDTVETVEEKIR
jgi:membrane fusion protein (multidrug efflux system)